jgi:hypothetical protein
VTDDILNHIPSVDELEPLTGDVEERLRAAFQLYIDGEIADVAVRARIETLKSATAATERIFSEQTILSDTMRRALQPLKPAPQFAETVGKAIETTTQSGRATTIGGLIALALIVIAIIGILVSKSGQPVRSQNAAQIERGTMVLASGERLITGDSLTISNDSLSTTGALTQPSTADIGATLRMEDIRIVISKGAIVHLKKSDPVGDGYIFDSLNAPARFRFSTRSKPLTIRLPGASVRIPVRSNGSPVKDSVIEVFVREDSTSEIIVASSNAELTARNSDGSERDTPLPERTRILISATGSVLERTLVVGDVGLGWRND